MAINHAKIRSLAPINSLSPRYQNALIQTGEVVSLAPADLLYLQGQQDEFLNYLLEGVIEFEWGGNRVKSVDASHEAASHPLDGHGAKRYSARARTDCTIFRVSRYEVDRVLHHASLSHLDDLQVADIKADPSSDWMVRTLQSGLFAHIPAANIQRIFARMEEVARSDGDILVEQGALGDYYYIIEEGHCEVTRQISDDRPPIRLATLGPGDAFGEEALISEAPRNATVRLISDGRLMRLPKADFNELIRDPLMQAVSYEQAESLVADGATWLDIRYPELFAQGAFEYAINMPLTVLRIQWRKLPKDERYIICGDNGTSSAVGAFLLAERGFDIRYLDCSMAEIFEQHPQTQFVHDVPSTLESDNVVGLLYADTDVVDDQPPPPPTLTEAEAPSANAETMAAVAAATTDEQPEPVAPNTPQFAEPPNRAVESTPNTAPPSMPESESGRIEQLKEPKVENNTPPPKDTTTNPTSHTEPVPREMYADTATGRSLADLIDEITEEHSRLDDDEDTIESQNTISRADSLTTQTLPPSATPAPAQPRTSEPDQIELLMGDLEQRLRAAVEARVSAERSLLEQQLSARIDRVRLAAAAEIRKNAEAIRSTHQAEYLQKEQVLKQRYEQLIQLATKISRQKAEINQARKRLEEKLHATDVLHREVAEIGQVVSDQIDSLEGLVAEGDQALKAS